MANAVTSAPPWKEENKTFGIGGFNMGENINISDDQIKEMARDAGFWGVDIWWKDVIPKFRLFLELAAQPSNPAGGEKLTESEAQDGLKALNDALKSLR